MQEPITIQNVESALLLVRKHLLKTPLVFSPEFSEAAGNEIYFKLENFQITHAFKARGALNKIHSLTRSERENGVIAASSGNHALGVAFSSALLGINAIVIMPTRAPKPKIEMAKKYGAQVILHGETYDDALDRATSLAQEQKRVLLSSFDDQMVIAGQGTIALEVLEEVPDINLFIGPIGGGGLVSGLGVTLDALDHPAELIGVEASGSPSMLESIKAGKRIKLDHIDTIADGIAVQQPGKLNFGYVQQFVKEILTVSDELIMDGLVWMLREMRVAIEPAAAAAPACLLHETSLQNQGKKICCIVSGGNISPDLLKKVADLAAGCP
jgi:threonine dehydratase